MKTFRNLLLSGAALLAAASCASAWDSLGHMLVSQIAWDQLTPKAREALTGAAVRFDASKKGDWPDDKASYDAVTAACWMDDIRSFREKYDFGKWHYINLPFTHDGLPAPDGESEPNVAWGIQRCTDIISGKAEDPAIDRDQALMMLAHLVGDVHQPLHTTNRNNDAGGNRVILKNVEKTQEEQLFGKGKNVNLHAFWDSAYRRTFRNGKAEVLYEAPVYDIGKPLSGHGAAEAMIRREAQAIEKKYPPSIITAKAEPAEWAKESHGEGYDFGYGKLPDQSPTGAAARVDENYVTTARDIAQKRIAMAGYRLGALLNELLIQNTKPEPKSARATP